MEASAPEITFGLRFNRADLSRLKLYTVELRSRGADPEQIGLFDKALEAAENDEPLLVVCQHPGEVKQMAAGFVRHGFLEPTIDHIGRDGEPVSGR